ncbi:hypothetical protein PSEEN3738 [Pseudomonas entomophila L48]|uniref:Uncharacterized protein n=1 Tax=Pseudomonas entomophila (strain L48) TaxID=384676 RepID=Q1I7C6_PSEE4|nr:hypothetical protein PSEEN3738 [Pseudomonas entomophila L48]
MSETTHSSVVAHRSRTALERLRWRIFKRGSIEREATELLLLVGIAHVWPELWRPALNKAPGTRSIAHYPRCACSNARMLSLWSGLVAGVQLLETSEFLGWRETEGWRCN